MFQDDWIMRQINDMVHFITAVVLQKETSVKEAPEEQKFDSDAFHEQLDEILKERKFAAAERFLLEKTDVKDQNQLQLAVDFYARLNSLNDRELEEGGFSRAAIQKGLIQAADRYGISLAALFLDLPK